MGRTTLSINGTDVDVNVEAEMPLLWVLRDVLGLCGTKFSCGIGACAACTVLVDGEPIRSCVTPVSAVAARPVTTIEGLADDVGPDGEPQLTVVQRAWLDAGVAQCGYCQTGQILTATALLAANPSPDDAAIDQAFAGVLCRCGTYQRIRRAVHAAAGHEAVP